MDDMKFDSGKIRPDYFIIGFKDVLQELFKIFTLGAQKYAPHSWQLVKNGEERYMAAFLRHYFQYLDGIEKDDELGISHLSLAIGNLCMVRQLQINKNKLEENENEKR